VFKNKFNAKSKQQQKMTSLFKTEFDFTNIIPYHYDMNNVLSSLKSYIETKETIMEERLYVLFDYPGMGKTTTIFNAAKDTNSLYVQIPMASSLMIDGIQDTVKKSMAQYRIFSEEKLISVIKNVCWRAILRIFEIVHFELVKDKQKIIFIIKGNGIAEINHQEIEIQLKNYVNSILESSGKQKIVLHFDECQKWTTPQAFQRQQNQSANSLLAADIHNYYMIGLSNVLIKLPRCVFVALSGTNVGTERRIRVDSGIKLYVNSKLAYTNASILLHIFKNFCNIGLSDQVLLAEFKKLEGPFRIFYYFMRFLYDEHKKALIKDINLQIIREFIEKSYSYWKNGDLFAQFSNNNLNFDQCLKEILFCSLYPQFFYGDIVIYYPHSDLIQEVNDDSMEDDDDDDSDLRYHVSRFKTSSFPDKWMKYHDIGIVRWKAIGDNYIMEKPFPFLQRLWCEVSSSTEYDHTNIFHLQSHLVAGTLATGGKGHAFQFAVALELSLPHSPLFKKILPKNHVPIDSLYRIDTFKQLSDNRLNTPGPIIYYACDKDKGVKDIDIVTFVLNDTLEPKKVYIQIKKDKNTSRCTNAVTKLFKMKADIKVMISWNDHNLKEYSDYEKKNIVVEGENEFLDCVIPFQDLFSINQFKNYGVIVSELKKHPFFQKFLIDELELNSKKRKSDIGMLFKIFGYIYLSNTISFQIKQFQFLAINIGSLLHSFLL